MLDVGVVQIFFAHLFVFESHILFPLQIKYKSASQAPPQVHTQIRLPNLLPSV